MSVNIYLLLDQVCCCCGCRCSVKYKVEDEEGNHVTDQHGKTLYTCCECAG